MGNPPYTCGACPQRVELCSLAALEFFLLVPPHGARTLLTFALAPMVQSSQLEELGGALFQETARVGYLISLEALLYRLAVVYLWQLGLLRRI